MKVQHHGVGSLMKTDLVTIEFIAGQMMKLHKGAPDFRVTLLNDVVCFFVNNYFVTVQTCHLMLPKTSQVSILMLNTEGTSHRGEYSSCLFYV